MYHHPIRYAYEFIDMYVPKAPPDLYLKQPNYVCIGKYVQYYLSLSHQCCRPLCMYCGVEWSGGGEGTVYTRGCPTAVLTVQYKQSACLLAGGIHKVRTRAKTSYTAALLKMYI